MNNIRNLTNNYLYELAQTNIDARSFKKVVTALQDIDACMTEFRDSVSNGGVKALLVDKLCCLPNVDKLSINDNRGFQIDGLDIMTNGVGPVMILIVKEAE